MTLRQTVGEAAGCPGRPRPGRHAGGRSDSDVSKSESPARRPELAARIAAARGGDERALEDVIRAYQGRVARFVLARIGGGTDDLDDLCQTVFVKMALSMQRLRSADAFEPWLFSIARNVCRDHLRRLRPRGLFVALSSDHEAVATEPPAEADAAVDLLESALAGLPAGQRELIDLLRVRDYSYVELARLTCSSVRTVAGRLFRARARLRKLMSRNGAGR